MNILSKASSLLAQLTLEEKASLCLGSDFWHTAPVERLGIPAIMVSDGPHGLRKQPDEADHVGISGSVPATCFPTACALGSSWDPELVRRVGAALGREARAQGVAVVLGPGINIKRSPLCGRNFEYFSEDPLLSGVLGAAMVDGVQSQGVGASLKHFAANNQETDRLRVSAEVDERTLREIYLAGFERAVTQARPWTVMCAYNKVNGVYASEHAWLLTTVLRGEWGFDGLVVSDWGAVHDRVAALGAGLDLEMPPNLGVSDAAIIAAVRTGQLDEDVLDAAVARVLAARRPGHRQPPSRLRSWTLDAHHALARAAATECAVLLKNHDRLLPLRPAAGDTIAVIGEFARTPRYQGAGSSQVNPTRVDVALDELRAAVPDGVEIAFAAGFGLDTTDHDDELAAEAVALARRAEVVVVFLGLPARRRVRGVRPQPHGPSGQPDGAAGPARRRQPEPRRGAGQRLGGAALGLGAACQGGARVLAVRPGRRRRGRRPAARRGQSLGTAGRDAAAAAGGHPVLSQLPRRGRPGPLRRRRLRRLPRLRRPRPPGAATPSGTACPTPPSSYADLTTSITGRHAGRRPRRQCHLPGHQHRRPPRQGGRPAVCPRPGGLGGPPGPRAQGLRQGRPRPRRDHERWTFALAARDLSYWSTTPERLGAWRAASSSSRSAPPPATCGSPPPSTSPRLRLPASLDGMSTLQEWLADPTGSTLLHKAVGTDATAGQKASSATRNS